MAEELHLQQQRPEEAQEQPAVVITDDANTYLPAAAGTNLPEDIADGSNSTNHETRKDKDATAVTNHSEATHQWQQPQITAAATLVADPAVAGTTTLLVDFPWAEQQPRIYIVQCAFASGLVTMFLCRLAQRSLLPDRTAMPSLLIAAFARQIRTDLRPKVLS